MFSLFSLTFIDKDANTKLSDSFKHTVGVKKNTQLIKKYIFTHLYHFT